MAKDSKPVKVIILLKLASIVSQKSFVPNLVVQRWDKTFLDIYTVGNFPSYALCAWYHMLNLREISSLSCING